MARRRRTTKLPDGRVAVDIGHAGRVAIFPAPDGIEGTEHDFSGSSDDWERRVFLNAVKFRLHRYHGRGARDEAHAPTFPEAMTMAAKAMDDPGHPGVRVLVYAVTESGRFAAIPEDRWPAYLELWKKERGADDISEHAPDKPEG